ncbi:AMP-binding protein [Streptomyces sp. AV19]|uniref:condensation domain-containing protein n=1 Tax=Streptomyces sp. AV19 TaxID=2793068 RepID=UPI0018FE3BEE|nr:condensation domain-containing protein [Streptomyces sp. AV19]MBH1938264.1 AMP-binding protein [Streptomyces sp. AV19]MDG4534894.1 AMP-binding protein [Streptomyces sp. AV19]
MPPTRGRALPECGPADRAPRTAGPADGGTAVPAGLPLTAAQAELWHAQARDPRSPALNTAVYREIRGPLDPVLFAEALHRTVGEADALRMRITVSPDGLRQRPIALEPPGHGFPLCAADLRGDGDAFATALAWMRSDLERPFDLGTGPLFAHGLFRLGDAHWLWYRRVHAAVLDAHGHTLVDRRVAEVYTSLAAGTDPGPSPFGRLTDLVAKDTAYRTSAVHDRDRAYWRRRLAGFQGAVGDVPAARRAGSAGADRAAGPARSDFLGWTAWPEGSAAATLGAVLPAPGPAAPEGDPATGPGGVPIRLRHTARLDAVTTDRLRELAAAVRGSWAGLLFAAQALHLCRGTRTGDIVLGLPMTGRTCPAALRVPGAVANVLPLRLTAGEDTTFAELVRQADLGIREARRHQRRRRAGIRRELGLPGGERALSGPLVNVVPGEDGITFAGAPTTLHPLVSGAPDDLVVTLRDADDGGLRVDHDTEPAADARPQDFLALLARLADRDPHLPLAALARADDDERARVLTEYNDTATALPPTTLIGPVEARAARTPGATALIAGHERLTYAELNARANRLARRLLPLGVRPGAFAAVALPRSADLVVAVLAVLKAGGAYIHLRPGAEAGPYERLAPVCVLTSGDPAPPGITAPVVDLAAADLRGLPATDPGRPLTPHHPAYAVRSDGQALVVPQSAADNRLRWMQGRYGLTAADRFLPGDDGSLAELLWPLREGAALVLDPDPAAAVREHGVTVAALGPELLGRLLAGPDGTARLRHVLTDGTPPDRADTEGLRVHHHYGPAGAAGAACRSYGPGEPATALRPGWNVRLHVLDPALAPCPPGVTGELCVAGAVLATGWPARPARTAARFTADPFGPPGTRMYRTGEAARRREDGSVELLGGPL